MDMIKTIFPYSFGAKDVTNLAIKIVVYLVVGAVVGLLCGIIGQLIYWHHTGFACSEEEMAELTTRLVSVPPLRVTGGMLP